MKKFYITTPIYYVNAKPHIGHACTTIVADVLARFWRQQLGDKNVFFLTGTDEHGAKIQEMAKAANKNPQQFVDEISEQFKSTWRALNISNDNFLRTTDKKHIEAVAKVLNELYENGYIHKGEYDALYCVGCEQYKTKTDLIDGKCPDHQKEPEVQKEEAYLFRLSKFQNELLSLIKTDKYQILPPSSKKEIVAFYEQGLQDIAISRRKEKVSWGIELPFDKNHTTYVWIDAFLNYLTGLGWPHAKENYKKFWPVDVQIMSKDILRVHATIWPAMLLALKEKLPKHLFIHGYFTINGQKMSKTLGNVIDPNDLVKKFGSDGARYLIISQFPLGQDGDVKAEEFATKFNADLANGIGNLVSRVLGMTEKYFDNKVPKSTNEPIIDWGDVKKEYMDNFENFKIFENTKLILDAIKRLDGFIAGAKPWEVAKTNQEELKKIIFNLLESVRELAILIAPFMPETTNKIFVKLNINEKNADKPLKAGSDVSKGDALFQRI